MMKNESSGGDNGSLWFWDWKSGHNFQQSQTIVQPGINLFFFHFAFARFAILLKNLLTQRVHSFRVVG